MVVTEDEKLTIRYPFMPRINDVINVQQRPDEATKSCVTDRWYMKRGDDGILKVKLKNLSTGDVWETEFELPE